AAMGLVLTLAVREERRAARADGSVLQLLRAAVRDVFASPVVVRLFALYFVAMYGITLVTPFIPILLQNFYRGPVAGIPGMIGATLTAAGIAMAVTTPLWGRMGDLAGRWRVLPICLAGVAVGLAVEGLAGALAPLQVGVFGVGLFQGGIGATVIALLALLAPPERRAAILNFSLMPSQLSWLVGPITGAALFSLAPRLPFGVGAALLLGALGLAVRTALEAGKPGATTIAARIAPESPVRS
ncbi:MAG TPA: MFS transporter, partial [Ktedonobacterales bacterium]|nr:MFS transporter [Ktedonobacterales bacterium]